MQQFTLYGVLRTGHEDKGALPAVAIGRVVIAMQGYFAPISDRSEGRPAAGPVGSGAFDAGKANLPTVFQAKAAHIDGGGNAPLALLLQRAFGSSCAFSGYRHGK